MKSCSTKRLRQQIPKSTLNKRTKHYLYRATEETAVQKDPSADVNRSDCNLRLVWSLMERKIKFRIAKSRFRLVKRDATLKQAMDAANLFLFLSPVPFETQDHLNLVVTRGIFLQISNCNCSVALKTVYFRASFCWKKMKLCDAQHWTMPRNVRRDAKCHPLKITKIAKFSLRLFIGLMKSVIRSKTIGDKINKLIIN